MQKIERTKVMSAQLQSFAEEYAADTDFFSDEEGLQISEALYAIFLDDGSKVCSLKENIPPSIDIYLRMLDCPPEQRDEIIESETNDQMRKKLEIARGDLARLFGCDDYYLEGDADLFDFSWAIDLFSQKKDGKAGQNGGVKLMKLTHRQHMLDLCLRIRPALSIEQANCFLTNVLHDMPIRHRSPVDTIYGFVLRSGDALGGLDQQRAFVRSALNMMAEYYQSDRSNCESKDKEKQKQMKEKLDQEYERRLEDALRKQERIDQRIAQLKQQKKENDAKYRRNQMKQAVWVKENNAIAAEIKALMGEKRTKKAIKQSLRDHISAERAQMHIIETITIFQQFADVEPGDTGDFLLCYEEELPQMDLLDNHYTARRHLLDNIEVIGAADDHLKPGSRKTVEKTDLYTVRLSGMEKATGYIVDELLDRWYALGMDFLRAHAAALPMDFPDRDRLEQRLDRTVDEKIEDRKNKAMAHDPVKLRNQLRMKPDSYGPFFYRSLRAYLRKAPSRSELRVRMETLIGAQKRFCRLMNDDNIFQYITSDYNYECIVGSNKKSWTAQEPSQLKSSRLEKIVSKADKPFTLHRNDVSDVPRSLLLLTELDRIDSHLPTHPTSRINAVLIECGYSGLYARRRLDQIVLTLLSFIDMENKRDRSEENTSGVMDGFHEFLKNWLMYPVEQAEKKYNVNPHNRIAESEIRASKRS